MLVNVNTAIPGPGRLVVRAIKSDETDTNLGIELVGDPHDTQFAEVVRTSDAHEYPVQTIIMYDRLHGKSIIMLNENDEEDDFRVVMTADVSLKIMK